MKIYFARLQLLRIRFGTLLFIFHFFNNANTRPQHTISWKFQPSSLIESKQYTGLSHACMILRGGRSLPSDNFETDSQNFPEGEELSSYNESLQEKDCSSTSETKNGATQGKQVEWDPDEWSEGDEIKEPSDSLPDTFVPTQPPEAPEGEWTDAPCAEETSEEVPLEDNGVTV
jgi:hypothetical protein